MAERNDDIKSLFEHLGLDPTEYREVRTRKRPGEEASRWSLIDELTTGDIEPAEISDERRAHVLDLTNSQRVQRLRELRSASPERPRETKKDVPPATNEEEAVLQAQAELMRAGNAKPSDAAADGAPSGPRREPVADAPGRAAGERPVEAATGDEKAAEVASEPPDIEEVRAAAMAAEMAAELDREPDRDSAPDQEAEAVPAPDPEPEPEPEPEAVREPEPEPEPEPEAVREPDPEPVPEPEPEPESPSQRPNPSRHRFARQRSESSRRGGVNRLPMPRCGRPNHRRRVSARRRAKRSSTAIPTGRACCRARWCARHAGKPRTRLRRGAANRASAATRISRTRSPRLRARPRPRCASARTNSAGTGKSRSRRPRRARPVRARPNLVSAIRNHGPGEATMHRRRRGRRVRQGPSRRMNPEQARRPGRLRRVRPLRGLGRAVSRRCRARRRAGPRPATACAPRWRRSCVSVGRRPRSRSAPAAMACDRPSLGSSIRKSRRCVVTDDSGSDTVAAPVSSRYRASAAIGCETCSRDSSAPPVIPTSKRN